MTPNQIKAVELLASSSLASSLKSAAENKTPFMVMATPTRGRYMVGVHAASGSETVVMDLWVTEGSIHFSPHDCSLVSEMMEMMSL